MLKKSILIFVFFVTILSMTFTSANTAVLDASTYIEGTTSVFEMAVTSNNERNRAYTVVWRNGSGFEIANANDTGITPGSTTPPLNQFFESFVINSTYIQTYGAEINATVEGTNLEGNDQSSIVAAGPTDLLIQEVNITIENFIGTTLGISAKVRNSSGSGTTGAQCRVDIETISGITIVAGIEETSNHAGDIDFDFDIDSSHFLVGVQYIADVNCFCATGDTGKCSNSADGSSGESKEGFLIDDIGDFIINKKWLNATGFHDDFEEGSNMYPAVYLKNEFGGKIQIIDGPARIEQEDINWSGFNNSVVGNNTLNGEGFVAGGRSASLCLLMNSTFLEEKFIVIDDVSFDDDTLEQHFFPDNIDTGIALKGTDIIMRTSIKPSTDEGILERCSEQFLLPSHAIGGNDIDVNFHLKVEGFDQELELESDEFNFYGQEIGQTFISLIDIVNLTTSVAGSNGVSCTEINITTTYNYYFEDRLQYELDYCFETFSSDVISGCVSRLINPDAGTDNTFVSTVRIPFVDFSGLGQVDVTARVLNGKDDGRVVGYGDDGTNNTFTFVANYSESCIYSANPDLQLQQKQSRALEGIENKTGTFRMSVDCPLTAQIGKSIFCNITAQIEDTQTVQKEVNFNCFIDANISTVNFNQMVNRTPIVIQREFIIPPTFTPKSLHTLTCQGNYFNLGSRQDTFSDTFTVESKAPRLIAFAFLALAFAFAILLGGIAMFVRQTV